MVKDSNDIDKPGALGLKQNLYQEEPACDKKPDNNDSEKVISFSCPSVGIYRQLIRDQRAQTVIRLPAYEAVKDDPILRARTTRHTR